MRLPLLFLHITGGMVGLLSGAVAMAYRKGSPGHRISGNVFVVAMLIMGACGSTLALMKHQTNNVFGGLLTFYMITTAWLTARHKAKTSLFDWGALVFAIVLGGSFITLGILVARGQAVSDTGVPLGMYFFLGTVPLLAAAGDIRMLVGGGISGTARVARHLWRMCFGLFIASGSFFLGQQQVFPPALRKQYLLFPLAILPLAMLIYWMLRVSFGKRRGDAFYPEKRGEFQRTG